MGNYSVFHYSQRHIRFCSNVCTKAHLCDLTSRLFIARLHTLYCICDLSSTAIRAQTRMMTLHTAPQTPHTHTHMTRNSLPFSPFLPLIGLHSFPGSQTDFSFNNFTLFATLMWQLLLYYLVAVHNSITAHTQRHHTFAAVRESDARLLRTTRAGHRLFAFLHTHIACILHSFSCLASDRTAQFFSDSATKFSN